MKRMIAVGASILLLASCAKRPDEIMAEPIAVDPYMQMDCATLASMKGQKEAELRSAEAAQLEASQRDAAAMSIIHVPLASMQGHDIEEKVARAKGEVQAINSAYQSKSCTGTAPSKNANSNSNVTVIQ